MNQTTDPDRRRQSLLLAAGALLGLAMAIAGMVLPGEKVTTLPSEAIASIDGQIIPLSRYQSLLSDLAEDSRSPLDESDRQFTLNRLIDEELLILRGIELGMGHSEPSVRKAIAAALIASIADEAQSTEIEESSLLSFYEQNQAYFAQNRQLQLHWYQGVEEQGWVERFSDFHKAESNDGKFAALTLAGMDRDHRLPDQPLPVSKVQDYLGSQLAHVAFSLSPGQWSEVIPTDGQLNLVYVVSEAGGIVPPFSEIKANVEAEYRRRKGDEALRDYLEGLRLGRDIQVRTELPGSQ